MAIKNGQLTSADDVMNAYGSMFKDSAQLMYNTGITASHCKNVFYDALASDSADTNNGFVHDTGSDWYAAPDLTGLATDEAEYIILEATSLSGAWASNNCKTVQIGAGKWILYCTSGTDAVRRAQMHKSLWYGTNGTDALIDDFASVTAVKVSHANDVGKQAHLTLFVGAANDNNTGTFANTTTNNNCSSWSDLEGSASNAYWDVPSGTTLHTVVGSASSEMGTDLTADELNNPADCKAFAALAGDYCHALVLCVGDLTWVKSGGTSTNTDYYGDDSIPLFTAADTLANEDVGFSPSMIFKDTAGATVINTLTTWNKSVDATSTLVVSISYDGGSNYETITDSTIARNADTGTALWLRFALTRTDYSKTDTITHWATKYNLY